MKNVRNFGVVAVGLLVAIAIWASPFDLNNTKDFSVGEPSPYAEPALPDQPHLQAAVTNLRTAKGELERADRDKGGHRDAAIRLTNNAISDTERAIGFERRH